jgi:hypothetical protein
MKEKERKKRRKERKRKGEKRELCENIAHISHTRLTDYRFMELIFCVQVSTEQTNFSLKI